jgi:UDP-N-acetylmuramyl pentapeptide phosphotransferase/UDP-N-acetylglucosamine-1-phosphate transferase
MLHLGALGFAAALAFTGFMIAAGVGDLPNHRSNHNTATPTSGGIGLVAALGVMCLGAALFYPQIGLGPELPYLLILAAIIAALGLFDDVFEGRTRIKFALIIGLSLLAVRVIGPPAVLPVGPYEIALPYGIGLAGAVLWIFVCANGVNFMDGANGFMGSFMFIASLALMMLAMTVGAMTAAILAGALAFGLLGFLPYNFRPKAQIFCGDVGSLLAGFVFAIASLMLVKETPNLQLLYVGPVLLLPFLADIFMTMVSRVQRKENLLKAHSSHLYQKLIRSGWSHAKVSYVYAGLGLVCANVAAFAVFTGMIGSLWGLLLLGLIAGVVKVVVERRLLNRA